MHTLLFKFFLFFPVVLFGQNHSVEAVKIRTTKGAKEYADRFREVSFKIVDQKNDPFLFDYVDTTDLESNLGKSIDVLGRNWIFIKDTVVTLCNYYIIEFDTTKMAVDSRDILYRQVDKLLGLGKTYHQIKNKFSHTSIDFKLKSSDETTFNKDYPEEQNNGIITLNDKKGFVVIRSIDKNILAFCALGYNSSF